MVRHKEILNAVNAMTRAWLGEIPADASTVLSGIGVWPLLALLADPADGPGREQLANALGIPADEAAGAVPVVLQALDAVPAVKTALAFWHRKELPIELSWRALLPDDALGELTGVPSADQKAVDEWASDQTDGLIPVLPVQVDEETKFVLASAILLRTRWMRPFTDANMCPETGPWRDRLLSSVYRRTHNLDRVRIAATEAGQITTLELPGTGGVDVYLVIGEEERVAADVMQAAMGCLRSAAAVRGDQLAIGFSAPGLTVETVASEDVRDVLYVRAPRFTITADHDLLQHPKVFGLDAVTDTSRGHFPGISATPLAVQAARQSATATFSATGFEAAAVTAIGAFAGGFHVPPKRARWISVAFDRPFGYFAVDRRTGLVLAAGWVNDPDGEDVGEAFQDLVDIGDLFPD